MDKKKESLETKESVGSREEGRRGLRTPGAIEKLIEKIISLVFGRRGLESFDILISNKRLESAKKNIEQQEMKQKNLK